MDNFQWLDEEKSGKKRHFLRDYWLHTLAGVIIFLLILLLIFNPSSTNKTEITPAALETEKDTTGADKKLVIRLPDKTTKLANEPFPDTAEKSAPESTSMATQVLPAARLEAPRGKKITTTKDNPQLPSTAIGVIGGKNAAPVENIANKTPSTPSALINTPQNPLPAATETQPAEPSMAPSLAPAPGSTIVETVELSDTPLPALASSNTIKETVIAPAGPSLPNTSTDIVGPAPAQTEISAIKPSTTTTTQTAKPTAPAKPAAPVGETTPTTPPDNPAATDASGTLTAENALGTLLKSPANHYTLQLYSASDEASARQFIANHQLSQKTTPVRIWQNGKTQYIVVYGDYATQNEANAAIRQLPANLQAQKPWVRSMQSVQEGIRQRLVRGLE